MDHYVGMEAYLVRLDVHLLNEKIIK
jgi:hypothetical protein